MLDYAKTLAISIEPDQLTLNLNNSYRHLSPYYLVFLVGRVQAIKEDLPLPGLTTSYLTGLQGSRYMCHAEYSPSPLGKTGQCKSPHFHFTLTHVRTNQLQLTYWDHTLYSSCPITHINAKNRHCPDPSCSHFTFHEPSHLFGFVVNE